MKTLLNQIPFKVGDQYESFEHELEYLETLKISKLNYDVYGYLKYKDCAICGYLPQRGVWLLFNADILSGVFYRFSDINIYTLIDCLNSKLTPRNHLMKNPFISSYTSYVSKIDDLILEVREKRKGKNIGLCITNSTYKINQGSISSVV